MKENISDYFKTLKEAISKVRVTCADGNIYNFDEGIVKAINKIICQSNSGNKLLFIGNGASASISSHMATDFWKNAGVAAISFNDSALLTCISNDYGYEHVFEKPIEVFANMGDILFAISSSGKSENILRGVRMARLKQCSVITLSGFSENNPLCSLGDINFYVPFDLYGFVEITHHAICHCIADTIILSRVNKVK